MTVGDILLVASNFLALTEVAKFGLFELGIQRPFNVRVGFAMVLALLGLFLGPGNATLWGVAAALVWFVLYRYALLEPGIADFNRARIRTTYWMLTNYRPGEVLEQQGSALRNFPAAQSALSRFDAAIKAQARSAPPTKGRGYKIATVYEELGLLHRMMNQFSEAEHALKQALGIVAQLTDYDRTSVSRLRAMIIFRLAELHHAKGDLRLARSEYDESLTIHQQLDDSEMTSLIQDLLRRIP